MSRIRPRSRGIVWATVAAVLLCGAGALATPSFGTSQATVATALYTDIDIHAERLPEWRAFLKVKGVSDVVVTSHGILPGGYSGWHSHPGLSIVSVTQGALWLYDAEDPSCAPTIVPAGHGFVEPGDHVHIVRNEGSLEARWTTTSIRRAGSAGRIDQPNPGNCPF
jgi:quercetin dioxygenase-like cupin family protein